MKKKVLALVLCVATAALVLAGCGTSAEPSPADSVVSEETGAEAVHVFDVMKHQKFTAEQNTQAMIDQIAVTAESSAEMLTDELAEQMVDVLIQSNNEFYDGANQTELYIWYGYLLTNKYEEGDLFNTLGTNLLAATEPVYLGTAQVEDVQDSLEAVLKNLDDLKTIIEEEKAEGETETEIE